MIGRGRRQCIAPNRSNALRVKKFGLTTYGPRHCAQNAASTAPKIISTSGCPRTPVTASTRRLATDQSTLHRNSAKVRVKIAEQDRAGTDTRSMPTGQSTQTRGAKYFTRYLRAEHRLAKTRRISHRKKEENVRPLSSRKLGFGFPYAARRASQSSSQASAAAGSRPNTPQTPPRQSPTPNTNHSSPKNISLPPGATAESQQQQRKHSQQAAHTNPRAPGILASDRLANSQHYRVTNSSIKTAPYKKMSA